jgi:hypothetical protein
MPTTTLFWIWHAVVLAAGLVCVIAGGLLPVYGRHISGWYRYHVLIGGIGGVLTIIAVALVFDAIYLSGFFSIFLVHVVLGTLLVLTLLAALGLALLRSRAEASRKAVLRSAHLWTGRFFMVLMVINILFGLTAMGLLFPCLL